MTVESAATKLEGREKMVPHQEKMNLAEIATIVNGRGRKVSVVVVEVLLQLAKVEETEVQTSTPIAATEIGDGNILVTTT